MSNFTREIAMGAEENSTYDEIVCDKRPQQNTEKQALIQQCRFS